MANDIYYDRTNHWISFWVDGAEVMRIKANGDVDLHSTEVPNAF